ncbi:MAG TPA: phosphate acetyltransferase [Candidatus Woesearchaeota archaeon]|nr:phosphate acetyltransferase [Candidatus Woesearchaeota archaeon]
MYFSEQIRIRSKKNPKRILFDESLDERILLAAKILSEKKIAKVILLGDKAKILKKAKGFEIRLMESDFLQFLQKEESRLEDFSKKIKEIRKKKKLTLEGARKLLEDDMYYAAMLLREGFVDGIVSGACHATSRTVVPAFQLIGTKAFSKVSSYFIMEHEHEIYLFADCAVNISPTEEELAEIAVTTARSALQYGMEPKVAMLSFSTKGSAKHELVTKVQKAVEKAKKLAPDILIEGEMQLDAAIVPEVCKRKYPDSKIKGNANILIFPDLDSGNIGYKLVQRFGKAKAIGPILQGLNKPINDLSRGCFSEEIVDIAAITCIQAQEKG